nr:hypothetical protein [Tanacetum cinerariifolium]
LVLEAIFVELTCLDPQLLILAFSLDLTLITGQESDNFISLTEDEESDSDHKDDPSIPQPPPEPPDVEFKFEPNSGKVISAVMDNIDEPNKDEYFDLGGKIVVSTKDEDVDYFSFMFVIRIFLPYLIHLEISPLFLSAESEDTIFDPVI